MHRSEETKRGGEWVGAKGGDGVERAGSMALALKLGVIFIQLLHRLTLRK